MSTAEEKPVPTDFDQLWNFSDPSETEAKFRELLQTADEEQQQSDWQLELATQIARTQGLQQRFDEAHETLDAVASSPVSPSPRVRVRYLLERGRVFNSDRQRDRARPLFLEAWDLACDAGEVALAVDAAHMLGITEPPDDALEWNRKALAVAETSADAKARKWRGSLHNNIGWSYFEREDYAAALDHFQKALRCRIEQGDEEEIRVAKWCMAKVLRVSGRVDEALATQQELHQECAAVGKPDGYVAEELGECLLALNRADEAREYFAEAYNQLSLDRWLCDNEPDRIARLQQLGGTASD